MITAIFRRLSVRAKVLLVVLTFLTLMPAATMSVVDARLDGQMREEARQTLVTAEAVFRKSLDARADNFLLRYRGLAGEARFRVVAGLPEPDAKTMARLLHDLAADSPGEHELFLFSTRAEGVVAGERRAPAPLPAEFARASAALTQAALRGETATGSLGLDGNIYTVVAVPVDNAQGAPAGALTVGVRLGAEAFRELHLPGTEMLLLLGDRIVASSFDRGDRGESVLRQFAAAASRAGDARSVEAQAGGDHYLALGGYYGGKLGPLGFRYVLLSSIEPRLRALEETRRTLLALGVAGILVSALAVGWLVRRVTRPLVALRDSAAAVGRGDFSQRIEKYSDDEVGDLAQEFNRMTASLRTSRAELERAMQTLKATQSQLIQSEKLSAVGQFVAGVAHELNNPLTAVVGFSEVLKETITDERVRGHLDIIVRSSQRCHKVVSSLLSFARQHPPERKLTGLNSLVDSVLELMAYDLRTSNITVVRDLAPVLPPTLADPHQLEQVFVNILSNARQAIEPVQREGKIIVRTRATPTHVVIEFEDNGPGIRPEHLARIFDPFFTTKPVGKGTGLGLSLVYGMIQEHGGNITAQSEFGRGATFRIELPVARSTVPEVFRSDPDQVFAPAGAGKWVLVVDDEPWILELAAVMLRREGYTVETAQGGETALALLATRKFDAIVSDWKMPGLNGVRLYEHLCATDPTAAEHVLFMTGDVVSDSFQAFLRDHSLACLAKPFSIGEFRAAIARLTAVHAR
jgi:signal transduction histidine kinase/CheY-like chemotaxis protein